MKKNFLLAICLTGLLAGPSQAVLYFYDGFNYAANTRLQAADTSNTWSTGGNNPYPTNRLGTLSYPALPDAIGNKVELGGFRSAYQGYSQRVLWNGSTGGLNNTNIFASFILNVQSIGTVTNVANGYVISLRNESGGRCYLQVSNNAANSSYFNIALTDSPNFGPWAWDTNGGNGYPPNTPLLIVMSYTNNAGTSWGEQLWVNPETGTPNPPAANLSRSSSSIAATNSLIIIGVGNATTLAANRSAIFLDELRVGSSWSDVTPSGIKPYPILSSTGVLPTLTNSLFTGSSQDVYVVVQNGNGIDATNVTVTLTSIPSGFSVNTNKNSEYGTVATSQTKTNSSPFRITAPLTGAVLGFPYTFPFTVSGYDTNGVYYSTNDSFAVLLKQSVSVTGQDSNDRFFLAANINMLATNTLMVITNSSDSPLGCTFADDAPWLSIQSNLTIAPHSASNVSMVAGPISSQGQSNATLAITYDHTVTNFQNFFVRFDVGPKIEPTHVVITNVGGVNLFADKYEPGEILSITATSTNNGAITVNNITNQLILPSGWSAPAPVVYPVMPVGSSTTTLHQITIPLGTANGTYTGIVENAANGSSWSKPFTIDVFYQPIPSASTSLVFSVVQGRTNSASITLTNAGNANTTFSFSGGLSWVINTPPSGTVTAQTSRTVSFIANATGQSVGTNNYTRYINWGNGSTSEVAVTVIVLPPPTVQYGSIFTSANIFPGSSVDAYITLVNNGSFASNVSAHITSTNASFSISGSPAAFGNINDGLSASNSLPVKIQVANSTLPGTYAFSVTNITAVNGGGTSSGSFSITVQPPVRYVTNTLSKSAILPGESVYAYIKLTNASPIQARSVLASVSTTNAGFTIQQSPAAFNHIAAGAVASNSQPVVIRADTTVLPGTYTFDVTEIVTADGFKGNTGSFTLIIQPSLEYRSTFLSATNVSPGESVNAYITLTNRSGSQARGVLASVSTTNEGFTITGSPASFGDINAGKTASNSLPVVIQPGTTVPPGLYTFDVTNIVTADGVTGGSGSFTLLVRAPVQYVTTVLSTNAILPGGSVYAYITLTNRSSSQARSVLASVSTTNTGFTVSGSPASFGHIAAGAAATNSSPVVIHSEINLPAGVYTFDVTDIITADGASGGTGFFTVVVTNTVFGLNVVNNPGGSRTLSWAKSVDGLSRIYKVRYTTDLLYGALTNWPILATVINQYTYTDTVNTNEPVIYYGVTVE